MSLVEEALKRHKAGSGAQPDAIGGLAVPVHAGRGHSREDNFAAELSEVQLNSAFLEAQGYSVLSSGKPTLLSQFRSIKRQLLQNLSEELGAGHAPVVAVTSAVPGDGKSFVTLNLATVLALEKDLSVTVVDYDPYRRHLSQLFGVGQSPGLLDQISAGAGQRAASFAHPFGNGRMRIISAGKEDANAPELLCSSAFDAVVDSLRATTNSINVFDCPPILATANAPYLASRADVTIVVVRAGVTSTHAVDEALARIPQARKVCLVFNGRVGSVEEGYYGYSQNYEQYTNAGA